MSASPTHGPVCGLSFIFQAVKWGLEAPCTHRLLLASVTPPHNPNHSGNGGDSADGWILGSKPLYLSKVLRKCPSAESLHVFWVLAMGHNRSSRGS